MRFQDDRESSNVEDRRGEGGGFRFPGGMGGGLGGMGRGRRGGLGIVGMIIVIGLCLYLGIDPRVLLTGGAAPDDTRTGQTVGAGAPGEDEMRSFVGKVLADTERTWGDIFQRNGRTYEEPHLVLFTGAVDSACGFAQSATGPFYCPADRKVYLDLSFYRELRDRFGVPGDFAQAYVIAHEIGHHVQTLLGITAKVQRASQGGAAGAGGLSVRTELQADCFAGIWGHEAQAHGLLDPGDLDEALQAASAIGDDRLQHQGGGQVTPDSFTHGTSQQRARWFKTGFDSGRVDACNTFGDGPL